MSLKSTLKELEKERARFSLEGWIARDGFWVEPLNRKLRFFINKPHHSDSKREEKWYSDGFECNLPTHFLPRLGYHHEPVKARLEVRLEEQSSNCSQICEQRGNRNKS